MKPVRSLSQVIEMLHEKDKHEEKFNCLTIVTDINRVW